MTYKLSFNIPLENIMNSRSFQKIGWDMTIFFGRGKKDDWCPYIGIMDNGRMICSLPWDKCYYEMTVTLANRFGVERVYADIKHIFEQARDVLDPALLDNIYRMAVQYGDNFELAYSTLMMIYYGMVSEENYKGTKLGRSLKMNGIHSLLKGGKTIDEAADECRGADWVQVQTQCFQRQIYRIV